MYTMVAQFFKWLYAKDRKDKDGNEISFVQDFFTDFASTTIGMFPVVKDIYNYFANDYEFSNFAYDSINSILSTTKDLFEVATKAAGGESLETSDYMKPLRNSLYAIGQITGLPTLSCALPRRLPTPPTRVSISLTISARISCMCRPIRCFYVVCRPRLSRSWAINSTSTMCLPMKSVCC